MRFSALSNSAIDKAERFFKTDIRYLLSGGFWLTLGKGFALLSSFLTSIAFANWLPEETYGVYRYVLSVLPILAIPTLAGIDTALARAVARGAAGTLYPALDLKMRWGMWGAVGSLMLAVYYFFNGNTQLGTLFVIAAAFLPLMEPFNVFMGFLTGTRDFRRQTIYGSMVRTVPSALLIGVVFITNNIFLLVGAYFASYTLLRFVFLLRTMRAVPRDGSVDLSALGYGKHLSLMSVFGILSTSLDKILIFHFGGGAALAGYYLALVPFKQMQDGLGSVTTLALPKLSESDAPTMQATLPSKVLKAYLIIIPVLAAYILAAPFAFELLYPKYAEYALLSQFFALQLLFVPIGIFYTAITARRDTKKLYITSISYSIVRILLILFLTPVWGIWGAASAIVATGLLSNLLTIFQFYRLR